MLSKLSGLMGTIVALGLVVAGVWGWGSAGRLSQQAGRPDLAWWAVKSGAVAALAAAQVLGMTFIVDAFYPSRRSDQYARLAAGMLCTVGLIGALGLAVASF
ncbi:MAG TPA: hypothetical protein VHD56_08465 [Tepidisphaeraceae bacterium]|nr:hypothetical protein [Tepidisphaeraceae bacterium]